MIELLARAQAGAVLRFGARVGGRHHAAADRYRLYVEVARDPADLVSRDVARLLGRLRRLLDTSPLRFVGLDLRSGAVELYHRIGMSDRRDIEAMLAAECLAHLADDLFGALAEAGALPVGDRLPMSNLAASVAVESHGATTVALFAHTVSILGRDLPCRERLMGAARPTWSVSRHGPEVSAALVDAPGGRRHHNMLTLAVTDAGPVHIGVGPRAPDTSPSDRRLPDRDRAWQEAHGDLEADLLLLRQRVLALRLGTGRHDSGPGRPDEVPPQHRGPRRPCLTAMVARSVLQRDRRRVLLA
jgi:hypothetical protein